MIINEIVYAGHSAVFLKSDDYCVAIDPWLEGNPRCPKDLINPERIDLIILTHGHSDHAGDVIRLSKQYGPSIAATYELAMILIQEGVSDKKMIPLNKGGTVEVGGLSVTLTNAYHSSSYDSARGTLYAGEACGVVVTDKSRSFYHAGDTCLFSDISLIGERFRPHYAFIPIGDRFTMGPKEAATAFKLCAAEVAIPVHYSTFGLLSGTAEQFQAECALVPELKSKKVVALEPGQTLET